MYRIPPHTELLSQGDIFRGKFAFPYTEDFAAGIQIVREDRVRPSTDIPDAWKNGSEVMLSPAQVSDFIIILSQSCDAENPKRPALEFVTIGAIRPLTELTEKNQEGCRHHKLIRYHHLAAHPNARLPESFVHFGLLALVRQPSLAAFKAARILALEFPHREDLGHRFGESFSRVALP
jgi:hypothetical protein